LLGSTGLNQPPTILGLSQGSTLGLMLFLIFINDLPICVKSSKCLLFADDLKLYLGVDTVADSDALQADICAVAEWSRRNRLPFNSTKCKTITFTRKRHTLENEYKIYDAPLSRASDIRDLGIVMASQLDFHKHLMAICRTVNKTLGFIMKISAQFNDPRVAIVLYNAYLVWS
jgi:hypothetical protein